MIGILLINLGTPDAPTETAVKKYLDEFLSDPYVITLPKLLRDFLVQNIILRTRPKKSAHAYQQIWTEAGSPLLTHSVALRNKLQEKLGLHYRVALGMRYGNPSVASAVAELKNVACDKVIVLPLFPQYSHAATQSAIDCAMRAFNALHYSPSLHIIEEFHQADFYIHAISTLIGDALTKNPTEFLLLSYHGLPKRQIDPLKNYQAQCFATSEHIAKTLQLPKEKYQTSFQSRLGLAKWIQPYTDQVIKALRQKGIKKLSIACPSFVCDCLETAEEINIRLRQQWMALGGEQFELITCLNADEAWIKAISDWLKSM
jgi:ferrochelatase